MHPSSPVALRYWPCSPPHSKRGSTSPVFSLGSAQKAPSGKCTRAQRGPKWHIFRPCTPTQALGWLGAHVSLGVQLGPEDSHSPAFDRQNTPVGQGQRRMQGAESNHKPSSAEASPRGAQAGPYPAGQVRGGRASGARRGMQQQVDLPLLKGGLVCRGCGKRPLCEASRAAAAPAWGPLL